MTPDTDKPTPERPIVTLAKRHVETHRHSDDPIDAFAREVVALDLMVKAERAYNDKHHLTTAPGDSAGEGKAGPSALELAQDIASDWFASLSVGVSSSIETKDKVRLRDAIAANLKPEPTASVPVTPFHPPFADIADTRVPIVLIAKDGASVPAAPIPQPMTAAEAARKFLAEFNAGEPVIQRDDGACWISVDVAVEALTTFSERVRGEERERCAKIADGYKGAQSPIGPLHGAGISQAGEWIAEAIRALSPTTEPGTADDNAPIPVLDTAQLREKATDG